MFQNLIRTCNNHFSIEIFFQNIFFKKFCFAYYFYNSLNIIIHLATSESDDHYIKKLK